MNGYQQHPRYANLKPGDYTDDTQMSIAVAETLLHNHRKMPTVTTSAFIYKFVSVFQRDPRDGYARGFQAFLESVKDAEEFQDRVRPTSEKNGGCMRAVPLGVVRNPIQVAQFAKIQAQATHNTEIGIFSAQAVALMSHFFLWSPAEATKENLAAYLKKWLPRRRVNRLLPDLMQTRTTPVRKLATETVHAVFDLITTKDTLSAVLKGTIEIGGDTDSVGAIAVGIASARMPNNIPQIMFDELETRTIYGPDFLKSLGRQLMDTYS